MEENRSRQFLWIFKSKKAEIGRDYNGNDIDFEINISVASEIEKIYNSKFYAGQIEIEGLTQKEVYKNNISPFKYALANRFSKYQIKESCFSELDYFRKMLLKSQMILTTNYDSPEFVPEITEKIRGRLDESGRLLRTSTIMPIEVYVAMPEEQAEEEHGHTCVAWELPDSKRIYFDMMELPENLVRVISRGWQREIVFRKKDAKKVFDILYPSGIKFKYKNLINRVYGEEVRLIGFGA